MSTTSIGSKILILHVAESFATGTLTSISRLVNGLQDGFEHLVLHGRRDDALNDFVGRFPRTTRLVEWQIQEKISAALYARALKQLRQLVAETRPQVIHAHSARAGALCRLSGAWRQSQVIYSPRAYAFQRRDIAPWQRAVFYALEFLLARTPHLTVACGRQEFIRARRLTRSVVRINNMVDLREVGERRSPSQLIDGRLRIATLGRITAQKNFPLFAEIARACPSTAFEFTWVGGGNLPAGVSPPDNLKVTGNLPQGEALATLAKSNVYMHPSHWEGLSNAVLEAMALGMPLVVSPPSSELVIERGTDRNGFVARTKEDYVGALMQLAENQEMLKNMGAASRRRIENEYSSAIVLEDWRSLYNTLSQSAPGKPLILPRLNNRTELDPVT